MRVATVMSKFKVFAIGILPLLAITLVGSSVLAQQQAESTGAANALTISPIRTEVTADPGDTKVVKVLVSNTAEQDVSVRPIQNDFVAGDEEGSPAIILEETEFAPSHSLKRFMQPLDSFILSSGESKLVEMEIVVPEDAEAGGYFGSLRFAPTDPNDGGQVNMSMSLASLVLLTVTGDTPEKLTMTDFSIEQGGRPSAFFMTTDDIKIRTRFQNDSNIHLSPLGKVTISKGKEVVFDQDMNNKEQKDYILPGSARKWDFSVDGLNGFGKYEVNAIFTYGSSNKTIEVSKTFWVIPLAMIIAGIAVVVLIVAVVIGLVLRSRHRKRKMSL